MPLLFFGTVGRHKKPKLFSPDLDLIEVHLWDYLTKLGRLVPRKRQPHVARLWHLLNYDHTALAWTDDQGKQQVIFIPGILDKTRALTIARENWGSLIPSPITFRIKESIWRIR